jgi:hypothetical protein
MASSNFMSARSRDSCQVLLGRQKSRKRFYDLSACCSSMEMSAKLFVLFLVLTYFFTIQRKSTCNPLKFKNGFSLIKCSKQLMFFLLSLL